MLIETDCRICGGRLIAGWRGIWYHADRQSRHRPIPADSTADAIRDWDGDEVHDFRERTRWLSQRRLID